jgi:hypothetical protein
MMNIVIRKFSEYTLSDWQYWALALPLIAIIVIIALYIDKRL